jgi:hypothetical protein
MITALVCLHNIIIVLLSDGIAEYNACDDPLNICPANSRCVDIAAPSLLRQCLCNSGFSGSALTTGCKGFLC